MKMIYVDYYFYVDRLLGIQSVRNCRLKWMNGQSIKPKKPMKTQKHLWIYCNAKRLFRCYLRVLQQLRFLLEEVAPQTGWEGYTIGAIGHVTEKALKRCRCASSCET